MFRAIALAAVVITASCASALTGLQDTALRLDFAKGVCSATAVGPSVMLAAEHCWANGNRLLKINGQEAHALKILRDGADHVLVRVNVKFKRYARMGPAPVQGDPVRWIGNPAGINKVYREGYIGAVTAEEVGIIAPIFGGDSGSGFRDAQGRVVGVISAYRTVRDRNGVMFTVAVAYPMKFSGEDWRAIR